MRAVGDSDSTLKLAGSRPWSGLPLVILTAVLLATSAQAGWIPDQRLTEDAAKSQLAGNGARCLAAGQAGSVHLVWYDYRDGNPQIYYKKFDGMTWTPDQRITADPAYAYNPSIATDPWSGLRLVWQDARDYNYEIYYKYFDGVLWGADQRLTNCVGSSRDPSMAVDGSGIVHLVWRDDRDGNDEIYYKRFDGTSWSADLRLTSAAGASFGPTIVVDQQGRLHVVWYDNRDGNYEIYRKVFDGSSWSADERVTNDAGTSEKPSAAVDSDGRVHVVWDDNRSGAFEIYHKVWDGAVWSSDESISSGSIAALAPAVAAGDSGSLHVAWSDKPTASDSTEIYYRKFDGTSWGAVERLTSAAKSSESPAVEVDAYGQNHVVWRDNRDANLEIYWKWNPRPLPPPEIVAVAPDSGFHLDTVTMEISGADLIWPISVRLEKSGEPTMVADSINRISSSHVSCNVKLVGAPGAWDVIAENVDGQEDTLPAAFRLMSLPKPEVISVAPDSGAFRSTVTVNIWGGVYVPPDSVWLEMAGQSRLVGKNVTRLSLDHLACDFTLSGIAGSWDVVVVNADGQRDTLPVAFRVLPVPGFRIEAIAPDSGWSNEGLNVSGILGSSFLAPVQVWLGRAGEPSIWPQNVAVVSSTKITCWASLEATSAGRWDVLVKNADGVTDTLVGGLVVLPAEWTTDTRLTATAATSVLTYS
ncbi:MAG TPA: hypothetical protein VMU02_09405, partial [bacterium]|nr:hypothetical protein [bacterium]